MSQLSRRVLSKLERPKREGQKDGKTHVEALIRSVLLAEVEVILAGDGEDSVTHSMSELDGGESW